MGSSGGRHRLDLSTNWTFTQGPRESDREYLQANNLPTEIYRDLLKNEKIPDPFLNFNELSVRWVAEETWTYRTEFTTSNLYRSDSRRTDLVFEGLDTFTSVYFNGEKILESDNMFVSHRLDVSSNIQARNVLELVFEPARKKGLELMKQHSEHTFIVHQTEVSRGPVRKAQYQWGWDWGPILLTCGPWKPIYLESYTSRIEDFWVEYTLNDGLNKAVGKICALVQGDGGDVTFEIRTPGGESKFKTSTRIFTKHNMYHMYVADFRISEIDLWWPRGYGGQNLYTVGVGFVSTRSELTKSVGFRKAELVQEKDEFGQSFYFRINNVDIFAGGSCWIPADSFLSRINAKSYREWIALAAEGNQTMIRVWGGGIYESEVLFDTCNELGLLVWQDFAFACANYPANPDFLKSVEEEARQNVRRLRNHPSLIIWAGNNEDYQIVERYNLEYQFEDKDPQSWLKTNFPARYIYEYLLPMIVAEETNGTIYHPSSPFGNGKSTTLKVEPTVGDIHQWNIWHGEMKPYQKFPEMGGRFVSEFGMEAYPHLETINKSVINEQDRYPGSMCMDFRNKAIGHERRLISYVAENFRIKYDLPNFIHLTQIMQADSMAWAYKCWRRQWGTPGKRQCGGVLVWQLNDCWPTMSWAVVDYYKIPKPAYYAIKRCLQPVVIGVTRRFVDWTMRPADALWKRDTSHLDLRKIWKDVGFDVWVASSSQNKLQGKVLIRLISISTGLHVRLQQELDVVVHSNSTTEVYHGMTGPVEVPDTPFNTDEEDPFIIHVSLVVDDKEIATDISWPDPIKYLHFPKRELQVDWSENYDYATITCRKPVKGFTFSEVEGIRLSDNGFDLIPGELKKVSFTGDSTKELSWQYVGM
ncbi:glycoside hydrolase [Delitschia confertaspora ATCC 74209]|uniref:Beta-mannosidase n=1 Tax=Delitschia confertaspora ATCC 74209 TaxID=1513339 RepID=A0A9P4MPE8_9PLEO|nr:glycoside hydrolase [Delitschia confertaspora ATCC 74209]